MKGTVKKEEEIKLKETNERIDELIEYREKWLTKTKWELGSGESLREQRRLYDDEKRNLVEARPNPYFGRVDFSPQSSEESQETYYIGRYHIPVDYVYSMWAGVASLYYDPTSDGYTVKHSGQRITGVVTLARHLQIENTNLIGYKDVYMLPAPGTKGMLVEVGESPLKRALVRPKSAQLQDIVETIQPQQYRQIVAGFQGVIIVQGVAGSGKSEVGIHRLAYLLSPHNELNLNISPDNAILFGPSKLFLKYVSSILPGLAIPKIKQRTVFDWLRSTLSRRIRIGSIDRLFERSLKSSGLQIETDMEVAKLKNSLKMARIIDKYVQIKLAQFLDNAKDIVIKDVSIAKRARIIRIVRSSSEKRLNEQRKRVLAELTTEIRTPTNVSKSQIQAELEMKFCEFWPEVKFTDAYYELFANKDLLARASKKILNDDESHLMNNLSLVGQKRLGKEDLPALCYLDHSLNNRMNVRNARRRSGVFAHIVVDEAQDVSTLELTIMKLHSINDSFTILGDIGQQLVPYKGIRNWREVRALFPRQDVRRWNAPYSYRSTYEISKYTKQILIKIAPHVPRPRPYKRHGEKPSFIRSKTHNEMINAVATDIRTFKEQGIQTVAVLCKTAKEALTIRKKLAEAGITNTVPLDKQGNYNGNIFVGSILLSKGLEYDAVILVNARNRNYPPTEISGKLLYIAVTRAAHLLHIHWFGSIANILAVPEYYKEPKKHSNRKRKPRQVG